jgi:hypothetical protein
MEILDIKESQETLSRVHKEVLHMKDGQHQVMAIKAHLSPWPFSYITSASTME